MAEPESTTVEMSSADFPSAGPPHQGPTIYIDGMQGALNLNGVFKIGLYQVVFDPSASGPEGLGRQSVGQLVVSQSALAGIHKWIGALLADASSGGSNADVDK